MNRRSFLASAVAAALAPSVLVEDPNALCEASLEQMLIDIKKQIDATGVPIHLQAATLIWWDERSFQTRPMTWEELYGSDNSPA